MCTEKKGDIFLEDFYAANFKIYNSNPDLPLDSGFLALIFSLDIMTCLSNSSVSMWPKLNPFLPQYFLPQKRNNHTLVVQVKNLGDILYNFFFSPM